MIAFLGVAEGVAVHVGLDLRQEVVGLGHGSAGEHDDLRVVGMDGRDDGGPEVAAETLQDLLGHAVAGVDPLDEGPKGDASGVVLVGLGHGGGHLARDVVPDASDDGVGRHQRLGAADVAAEASPSAHLDGGVAEGDATGQVLRGQRPAADDGAGADARADGQPDHVLTAASGPEAPLGERGRGAVVDASNRHAEVRFELLAEREVLDTRYFARQVPDAEVRIDQAGSGDTSSAQRLAALALERFIGVGDEALPDLRERLVRGLLGALVADGAVVGHDTELGACATDVESEPPAGLCDRSRL